MVTANYGGQKGNEITIQVAENVLDSTKRDVITYLGTDIVDKQVVTDVKDLVKNKYVQFSGEGEAVITLWRGFKRREKRCGKCRRLYSFPRSS